MNRPVHFEFHVPDVQTALKFYADVFGWKSQRFPGPMEYYLLFTGEAIKLGIDLNALHPYTSLWSNA